MPTTSFVELNLIYYYYLIIYHYVLGKKGNLVLTYGTYLPIPCHIVVTTFQLVIPVGSQISLDISLGFPPHHLQWN